MEFRKMILTNLFAGQEQRPKHREQTSGHSRGRRQSDEWRVVLKHVRTMCNTDS